MIGRWDLYGSLMRSLREAGFTPDDADRAARLMERAVMDRRDEMLRAAYRSGQTVRQLAATWGLSKTHVHRIVSPEAASTGTPETGTV